MRPVTGTLTGMDMLQCFFHSMLPFTRMRDLLKYINKPKHTFEHKLKLMSEIRKPIQRPIQRQNGKHNFRKQRKTQEGIRSLSGSRMHRTRSCRMPRIIFEPHRKLMRPTVRTLAELRDLDGDVDPTNPRNRRTLTRSLWTSKINVARLFKMPQTRFEPTRKFSRPKVRTLAELRDLADEVEQKKKQSDQDMAPDNAAQCYYIDVREELDKRPMPSYYYEVKASKPILNSSRIL